MRTRIANTVIALIALITFVFVADRMVWDSKVWECTCTNPECEWCTNETMCNCEHDLSVTTNCACWVCYEDEAYAEYADEFTALFNSYETKWSKNNRLMMRQGDSGSFKFVARKR